MSKGRNRYLVSYDIREDQRLRAVHRTMKAYGWAMQYSVFICDLDAIELLHLRGELGAIIDHRVDSVAMIDLGNPVERGRNCFRFMGAAPVLPASGPTII